MDHPLILIRHAEPILDPDTKAGSWKLSEIGQHQAAVLSQTLKGRQLKHIISSAESKAIETAKLVAEGLNISASVAEGLHEHDRSNTSFIKSKSEFEATVIKMFRYPDELIYGAETATQAKQRFANSVHQLSQQYADEPLAIVSHGTVMTLFVAAFNDVDPIAFWKSLEFTSCFVLSRPDFKLLKTIHPSKIGG